MPEKKAIGTRPTVFHIYLYLIGRASFNTAKGFPISLLLYMNFISKASNKFYDKNLYACSKIISQILYGVI